MLPKLIDTGSFFIPTYGVLVATAFLVAIWITTRLARRFGMSPERVTDLAIVAAIAGMVGAKLTMFLFDWDYYSRNWREIFSLGTLFAAGVYQGGLALAILVAIWYIRRNRMPLLQTFDIFAPGVAIGHGIGRLGCFAAGCCWGDRCDLPWAVTFTNPDANDITGVPLGVPLHPTQIYEAIAEGVIFLFLMWYVRRPHGEGSVIGWYLILYSAVRFAVEFIRHHEQALVSGLSLTQWISLVTFAFGAWLLARAHAGFKGSTAAA
jgi:phosphatidylglycerol:prolipoprotein diacylglycerol transferase